MKLHKSDHGHSHGVDTDIINDSFAQEVFFNEKGNDEELKE
jgi:hypothetical protein